MPAAVSLSPQLLSRASTPPNGDGWLHEIKYDGYRLLSAWGNGHASLFWRPGADWTSRLPWIADAVASLTSRSVSLDGELVYLTDDGFPDFERLWDATRSSRATARLYYQVFDVLNIDGTDLTSWPVLERKERLLGRLRRNENPGLRYVAHTARRGSSSRAPSRSCSRRRSRSAMDAVRCASGSTADCDFSCTPPRL